MSVFSLALKLMCEYENGGKYANLAVSSHALDTLSAEERAAVTALFYTAVERKITYDYYIKTISKRSAEDIDTNTGNILRIGMCALIHMNSISDYAAVNEVVKLARNKGEASFVNAVLRELSRLVSLGELPTPPREKNLMRALGVEYSFPLPLVRHFESVVGSENVESLLASINSQNYTDLTVNIGKISRADFMENLKAVGISAYPSEYSELTVRIDGSCNPRNIPGFSAGHFFVEDTASALAVLALGINRGDKIIDVCAAPGGKTFAAAILTGNGGEVSSFDIHESKLSLIESGRERLDLDNIKISARDATKPDTDLFLKFDRVICDAPCSGLGVLGKKADMRYRDLSAISELPVLQYEILSASANYVRQGGTIVYSTCTINPAENEEVVKHFLGTHPEFSATEFAFGDIKSHGGMFTAYPHIHKTDGFFISKLTRNLAE